jgi:hypothetical protein
LHEVFGVKVCTEFPKRIVGLKYQLTVRGLAQWQISEHKTVNTPQKMMRGRMFN